MIEVVSAGGCWASMIYDLDYRDGPQGSPFCTHPYSRGGLGTCQRPDQAGGPGIDHPWWESWTG